MNEQLATKITQIIPRPDGSEVRIIAEDFSGWRMKRQIHTYVHKRKNINSPWVLCSDSPHPDWKTMSLNDYNKFGRSEKLQAVSHGELFKVSNMIGQPISTFH